MSAPENLASKRRLENTSSEDNQSAVHKRFKVMSRKSSSNNLKSDLCLNATNGDVAAAEPASLFSGLPKNELILLILQTLSAMGFQETKEKLQEEANVELESPPVKDLHDVVLAGDWDSCFIMLLNLNLEDDVIDGVKFLIYEQRYLELVAAQEIDNAIICLKNQLRPAVFNSDTQIRMIDACTYLMCSSLEDLELQSGWRLNGSRAGLWDSMCALLPSMLIVPPQRLAVMLRQAVKFQEMRCVFHNVEQGNLSSAPFSLLQDHICRQVSLPTNCLLSLDKHFDEVWFVAVSYSGKYLASSSKDKTIIIWDAQSRPKFKISSVLIGHAEACSYISWSPNDKYLATASNDRTVHLWRPGHSEPSYKVFSKHTESVTSVGWFHDSQHFVSAGFDKNIYMWSVDTLQPLKHWSYTSRIQDLAITHDGNFMLVVNSDRNIKVIDLATKKDAFSLPESDAVTSICSSKLGNQFLANISSSAPVIRLWDLTEKRVVQKYLGHYQGRFVVRSCFGGPNEQFVVSGSEDSQIYIWHRHFGSLLEVISGHASTVNCVCWPITPIGGLHSFPWLISCADDNTIRIWSSSTAFPNMEDGSQECRRSISPEKSPKSREHDSGEQEEKIGASAPVQASVTEEEVTETIG